MEAISSVKTTPEERTPMNETTGEANDCDEPIGQQRAQPSKKMSRKKGCGKGIRRAVSGCPTNSRPSRLAMAVISVLTLVATTIYYLGKVLIKFLSSSADIGTDVLQSKPSKI